MLFIMENISEDTKTIISISKHLCSWCWVLLLLAEPVHVLFYTLVSGCLIMHRYPHQLKAESAACWEVLKKALF